MTFTSVCIAAALVVAGSAASASPQYHLTDLGSQSSAAQINRDGSIAGRYRSLPALWQGGAWHTLQGSNHMEASGLNSKGAAVGTKGLSRNAEPSAVMWKSNGRRVDNLAPGADMSFGTVIRSDGTVYGTARTFAGDSYPFTWNAGHLAKLPAVPGWLFTTPKAVNKSGQIAGTVESDPRQLICPAAPVLYTGGAWQQLGSLGGDCGRAYGINNDGVVVGVTSVDASDLGHAFMWRNGMMTDLGSLGGGYAEAYDINVAGVIVGITDDAGGGYHPFRVVNGVMQALDALVDQLPDGTMLDARSINDVGQIVVNGVGNDGQLHVYLLDPI